jgi:hypothetical protein
MFHWVEGVNWFGVFVFVGMLAALAWAGHRAEVAARCPGPGCDSSQPCRAHFPDVLP